MLFNEIYGKYYNTVAKIIKKSLEGKLSSYDINNIIRDNAFEESILTIKPAIINQDWKIFDDELNPILNHPPTQPLSNLEKQWLKAISLDPKMQLFDIKIPDFPDVKPLFKPENIVIFDQHNDGDNYSDENYQKNFRTIRQALLNGDFLKIKYVTNRKTQRKLKVKPLNLEYSEKDDKFRLIAQDKNRTLFIKLSNVKSCKVLQTTMLEPKTSTATLLSRPIKNSALKSEATISNGASQESLANSSPNTKRADGLNASNNTNSVGTTNAQESIFNATNSNSSQSMLSLSITNERNALERALLHFSHFETQAFKCENNQYIINILYDKSDENELVIRVLAFGPMVKVVKPKSFIKLIRAKLSKQLELF